MRPLGPARDVLNPRRMKILHTALSASLLFTVACDPVVDEQPSETLDLAVAMGVEDAGPVGVTVTPDTGVRYVLDEFHGLYRLTDDGAEQVLAIGDFPTPDVFPVSNWTDIVALGDERFALTAVSDGYLLDLAGGTLMQHFCYEPGWDEWDTSYELTTSLGFDAGTNSIIAQPQTISVGDTGESPMGAAVGVYDASLGGDAPEQWYGLPDANFLAAGMAVESASSILLVEESGALHRFSMDDQGPQNLGFLEGTERVGGATLDGDRLLVVDAGTDQLLSYPVSR